MTFCSPLFSAKGPPFRNGGAKWGASHLWGFVPDDTGFNFIVNLKSGLVLDVANDSLKNYATVWQYPFDGGDSQRWQLLK